MAKTRAPGSCTQPGRIGPGTSGNPVNAWWRVHGASTTGSPTPDPAQPCASHCRAAVSNAEGVTPRGCACGVCGERSDV